MNVRILTDRIEPWLMAVGHREDVQVGSTLGDPWSGPSVLIVDLQQAGDAGRISTWVSQANPLAVITVLSGDESQYNLMSELGRIFPAHSVCTLASERYGAGAVWHNSVSVTSHDSHRAPKPTHGPGVRTQSGRPVFWNFPRSVVGVPVSRDEPLVVDSIYHSSNGERPLWVQPGFPTKIPSTPQTYIDLDGNPVSGVLCATQDPERVGGWDVLEFNDVALLMGYEKNPFKSWSEMASSFPTAAADALVRWANSFNPDH